MLARPRYRTVSLVTSDGPQTLRMTEGRLPETDESGALALVAASAKLAALLDAPSRKTGSVDTTDGTERLSLNVPAADHVQDRRHG